MNEELNKNNSNVKVLTILVVILIVLVLCLGGYLVYDKVINKDVNETEFNNEDFVQNKDEVNLKNKFSLKTSSITQVAKNGLYEAIVYNGQAYLNYNGEDSNIVNSNYGTYYIEGLKNPDSDNTQSYKLDKLDNVVSVYSLVQGNGEDTGICTGECFAFILDTGNVAVINTSAIQITNQINVNVIEGLENIVTFVQGRTPGSYNSYAIDMDGNIIDLSKYFN